MSKGVKKKFNIDPSEKMNTHENSKDDYKKYVSKKNIEDIKNIYKLDYEIFFE